jgi:hypothetical protein
MKKENLGLLQSPSSSLSLAISCIDAHIQSRFAVPCTMKPNCPDARARNSEHLQSRLSKNKKRSA